ncbi:AMP-binding protein [Pseudomonas tohonis]|uniref:AMP-binding protein n=1 Tax=Pseudomonas tohonis TaxID=2725477 RepID=UPI001F3891FE|nr:AMP-binding protein [Pseudomonas tohonis]
MRPDTRWFRQLLEQHAGGEPQRCAIRGIEHRYTYAQLLDELAVRESRLRAQPAGPIALLLDNGTEALLWDLAALLSERPCIVLPPFFTASQRAHCLQLSQAPLVLAGEALTDELHALGYLFSEGFWKRPVSAPAMLPAATAKITYTSGSTGTPKGVCLSAESLLRVARELEAASRSTGPSRYLAVLPLGVLLENLGVYAALIAGAEVTLLPLDQLGMSGASGIDLKRLLSCILLSGAQSLILVPQLLLGLVTAIERGLTQVGALRFVAVGGARVSASLLARAQAIGLPVFEGYGLSECASVVCLNRPEANRPGTVGRPLPHVEVCLAEDGEVLVRGSTLLGYLGEPPPVSAWWPTGDLGHFDADGYLHILGRKKNQFITSLGRNVNPEWVEAELTQDGTILQAYVQGEGLAHNLALLWPLSPETTDAQLEAAVQRCNRALPDYARVHRWVRLAEPFTSANGLLTGNGRPRREAIYVRYQTLLNQLANE